MITETITRKQAEDTESKLAKTHRSDMTAASREMQRQKMESARARGASVDGDAGVEGEGRGG